MSAYRRLTYEEKDKRFDENYDVLIGPDDFECMLGEPEDRNWCRDGRAAVDRLNEQHAEIERLRAIVDRLPKTADGVPITPGMKVWHCANEHYGPRADRLFAHKGIEVRMPNPYCLGEHCYSEGCQGDDCSGRLRGFDECYSTREAAEKARKPNV